MVQFRGPNNPIERVLSKFEIHMETSNSPQHLPLLFEFQLEIINKSYIRKHTCMFIQIEF